MADNTNIFKRKKVLIIDYLALPRDIQNIIQDKFDYGFGNDRYLEVWSELDREWSMEEIEKYMSDQKANGIYPKDGVIEDFVTEYGLQFEYWMIKNGHVPDDFKDYDILLMEICW